MERKHGHLLNVTRVLLFQSNLPKTFWSYAVSHSVFLINRLATPVLNHKTPFELLHGIPPTFLDLKVFGCLSYASTLLQNRRKLDPRARKCIFLGFKHGTKGYLLYDWHTRDIFISRNAIFFESIFPYHPNTLQDSTQDASDQQEYQLLFDTPNPISTDSSSSFTKQASQEPNQSSIEAPAPAASEPAAIQPRRSTRQSKAPTYLQDFHCNSISTSSSTTTPLYPLSSVLSYHKLSPSHLHFVLSITSQIEPTSYKQAIQHEHWIKAMHTELQALEQNSTWTITDLPPGKTPIGCRWVYRIKYHSDGTIERFKARLVAKGFTQVEGIDFFETYSPVAKLTTIRLLLAIASSQNWYIQQLDVHNAFLHGDLTEEVYMTLPPGYPSTTSNLVCKLQKSIYGLRQSSRQWFAKLSTLLLSNGFNQSASDHSFFIQSSGNSFTTLLVYVDDLLISGK